MSESRSGPVTLVGGGSMGVGWAIVFARAGLDVGVHDASADVRGAVLPAIEERLAMLTAHGLLDESPQAVMARVRVVDTLADALDGAIHVQESIPERLDLKIALFRAMDQMAPPDAVLASSTSSLPASEFASDLPGRARCLVAHPANPPHLLPIVEIVPAPFTDPAAAARTRALMARAGQVPVVLMREVNGFIYNRLQGAVLREAYWMLEQGIADVADIDKVMTSGLGLRWSIVGPFETADLNYRGGLAEHAQRMGERYRQMGAERGQPEGWSDALVARATVERRALLPLEDWETRVAWRDARLMAARATEQAGDKSRAIGQADAGLYHAPAGHSAASGSQEGA